MFYQLASRLLHKITSPASDGSLGVEFYQFFDEIASMKVSGCLTRNNVILHGPGNERKSNDEKINMPETHAKVKRLHQMTGGRRAYTAMLLTNDFVD
jgi:hypothetical protein